MPYRVCPISFHNPLDKSHTNRGECVLYLSCDTLLNSPLLSGFVWIRKLAVKTNCPTVAENPERKALNGYGIRAPTLVPAFETPHRKPPLPPQLLVFFPRQIHFPHSTSHPPPFPTCPPPPSQDKPRKRQGLT